MCAGGGAKTSGERFENGETSGVGEIVEWEVRCEGGDGCEMRGVV